jgi:hypothetical protein
VASASGIMLASAPSAPDPDRPRVESGLEPAIFVEQRGHAEPVDPHRLLFKQDGQSLVGVVRMLERGLTLFPYICFLCPVETVQLKIFRRGPYG